MSNNQSSLQNILNLAMQNMHRGEYQKALILFSQLESFGMEDHRLFQAMGSAYQRLHQDNKTLEFFNKSLLINNKQADLHFAVGNIYKKKGELGNAISHAKTSVELDPTNDTYRQELGFILLISKDFHKALSIFSQLVDSKSHGTIALLGMSRAYEGLGNEKERGGYLELAEKKAPDNPMVLNDKAWLLKGQGLYQESKTYFARWLDKNPKNAGGYENLALIELSLDNPKKALDTIDEGLEKLPESRLLHRLKSSLSFEMGQNDHLVSYRNVARDKMSVNLHIDFISALLKADNVVSAEVEFDLLSKRVGPSLDINSLWLAIQEKQQNYEAILEFFKKQSGKSTRLPNPMLEPLARTYFALAQPELAVDVITELLNREPNNQYFWALYSTAMRMLESENYHDICNFNDYVLSRELILPKRFQNIEDFNSELKITLEKLHITKQHPLEQSLMQGTQTPGALLNKPLPIIREFKEALRQTSEIVLASLPKNLPKPLTKKFNNGIDFSASWSVNLNKSGYHKSHVHSKGYFSSAYYVSVPSDLNHENREGWLYLGKPGINLPIELPAQKWIKPEPGTLVLFPSFMWHGTKPFTSEQRRLTVAFDILPK